MNLLLILIFVSYVNCQNDPCETWDGRSGYCSVVRNCEQIYIDFQNGISPTRCGNGWTCCPYQKVNQPPSQPLNIRLSTQAPTTKRSYNRPQNIRKRISEQKCDEYSKNTVKESFSTSLSLHDSSSGEQSHKEYSCKHKSTGLIIGGVAANIGEFPHMAVLGTYDEDNDDYNFSCGGSLISNYFVLTAAHCQIGNPTIVRLGDNILNSYEDGANERTYKIEKFIRHEKYNSRSKKNDIAVVKLAQYVTFNDYIRPACLWTKFNIPKSNAIAIGHGSTEYGSYNSDQLMKAQVAIHSNDVCNDDFDPHSQYHLRIDSSQLCAGGGDNDTCQGDSGGPIQIQHGENICIYHIIGVTSFGSSVCGYSNGVYARVSQYLDWIERQVWG